MATHPTPSSGSILATQKDTRATVHRQLAFQAPNRGKQTFRAIDLHCMKDRYNPRCLVRAWRNWQTRQLEGLVLARECWFDPSRAHQLTNNTSQQSDDKPTTPKGVSSVCVDCSQTPQQHSAAPKLPAKCRTGVNQLPPENGLSESASTIGNGTSPRIEITEDLARLMLIWHRLSEKFRASLVAMAEGNVE